MLRSDRVVTASRHSARRSPLDAPMGRRHALGGLAALAALLLRAQDFAAPATEPQAERRLKRSQKWSAPGAERPPRSRISADSGDFELFLIIFSSLFQAVVAMQATRGPSGPQHFRSSPCREPSRWLLELQSRDLAAVAGSMAKKLRNG